MILYLASQGHVIMVNLASQISMKTRKRKIPILLGPTAVGKTAVSVPLASKLNAEIISADSRLVYKHLDIGTAKPTIEEMGGIPHHMINLVSPGDDFTVADFKELAYRKINEIHGFGKEALIVGGTGLYIRALVDNPSFQHQPPVPELRERILKEIEEKGSQAVHDELAEIDGDAAEVIHPHNIPRLVRAIEVIRSTGIKFSDSVRLDRERSSEENPWDWVIVGLKMDRELLYKRINQRVKDMIDSGWESEVGNLLAMGFAGDEKPLTGLGYRDIVLLVKGETAMDEAIEKIRQDTRRFAKRQMTFTRKIPGITWIEIDEGFDPDIISDHILKLVRQKTAGI